MPRDAAADIQNGIGQKGNIAYMPAACFQGTMQSLAPTECAEDVVNFQENIMSRNLVDYAIGESRRNNVKILHSYLLQLAEFYVPKKKGKPPHRAAQLRDECKSKADKLYHQENALSKLADHLSRFSSGQDGTVLAECTFETRYNRRVEQRSRRYVDGSGVQAISNASKHIAVPNKRDWDIVKTMYTLAWQIIKRVNVLIDHPAASFKAIEQMASNADDVFRQLRLLPEQCKRVCIKVVNGGKIPEELSTNLFLKLLQQEGILLRWLAASINPEFLQHVVDAQEKQNPAATVWFYTWTSVEDYILEAWVRFVLGRCSRPAHLSLHFDGIMTDPNVLSNDEEFAKESEEAILHATRYRVKIARKCRNSFMDTIFGEGSTTAVQEPLPGALKRPGNCALAAIARATAKVRAIAAKASASNKDNRDAMERKVRTYRQAATMCDVHLLPVRMPEEELTKGWFLVHSENKGTPHCVALYVGEGGNYTVIDGDVKCTLERAAWARAWDAAIDRKYLVLFQVTDVLVDGNSPENLLLDLEAGARRRVLRRPSSSHHSYPSPKRGKGRLLCGKLPKFKNRAGGLRRVPKEVRYVPTEQNVDTKSRGCRSQHWCMSLTRLAQMTERQTIEHLRGIGLLKNFEGVCPLCGSASLKPLRRVENRGWVHRCNAKCCHKFVYPHSCHPIFNLGWGSRKVSLNEQAQVLFGRAAGIPSGKMHLLTGISGKVIERVNKRWLRAVRRHVLRQQSKMVFGDQQKWTEVEVDETSVRGAKSKDGQRITWVQYCGLIARGDRRSLTLVKMKSKTTRAKTHGKGKGSFASSGPISKAEWKPICDKFLKRRKIILHSDGARAYRYTKVPGVVVDTVKHKRPRPVYAARWCHRLPLDYLKTNLVGASDVKCVKRWVKKGTQIIDRVWGLLKNNGVPKTIKARDDIVDLYTREFQWKYWNEHDDKWKAMGHVISGSP